MTTQNLTRANSRHEKKAVRVFSTVLDYTDEIATSADIYELFELPDNAMAISAGVYMLTAFDSATSAVVDLGFGGDDTLVDGGDLTSAAGTNLTGGTNSVIPQNKPTGGTVTFKPTYTGATTEGKCRVTVEYIEYTRHEQGEYTNFSAT